MRLGNSSRSPTIAGLVLEHLCPAIQNILKDGLKDHKLDLIIGQQRNHCWSVVEVSTRIGKYDNHDSSDLVNTLAEPVCQDKMVLCCPFWFFFVSAELLQVRLPEFFIAWSAKSHNATSSAATAWDWEPSLWAYWSKYWNYLWGTKCWWNCCRTDDSFSVGCLLTFSLRALEFWLSHLQSQKGEHALNFLCSTVHYTVSAKLNVKWQCQLDTKSFGLCSNIYWTASSGGNYLLEIMESCLNAWMCCYS